MEKLWKIYTGEKLSEGKLFNGGKEPYRGGRMAKRKGVTHPSKGVDKKERVKMGALKDAREKDRRAKK